MKRIDPASYGNREGLSSSRRRVLGLLGSLPAICALGSCDPILPGRGPAPTLYTLTPKSTFSPTLPSVDWQLVLEVPYAPAALNTVRIGIMPTPTIFDYYAQSSWTDRAPLMVQTLMIESFENSGRIVSVGRESVGLRADFVLKTELRELQMEAFHEDGARVHVAINAKLVRMPQRVIVAAAGFRQYQPADPDRMAEVIPAFDRALGKVMKGLVEWTILSGQREIAENPAS